MRSNALSDKSRLSWQTKVMSTVEYKWWYFLPTRVTCVTYLIAPFIIMRLKGDAVRGFLSGFSISWWIFVADHDKCFCDFLWWVMRWHRPIWFRWCCDSSHGLIFKHFLVLSVRSILQHCCGLKTHHWARQNNWIKIFLFSERLTTTKVFWMGVRALGRYKLVTWHRRLYLNPLCARGQRAGQAGFVTTHHRVGNKWDNYLVRLRPRNIRWLQCMD